jgi:hypothetical protein
MNGDKKLIFTGPAQSGRVRSRKEDDAGERVRDKLLRVLQFLGGVLSRQNPVAAAKL